MKRKLMGLILAGTMAASLMAPAFVYAGEAQETETEQGAQAVAVSSVSIEDGIMTIYVESDEKDSGYSWEYSREATSVELLTDSTQEGYAYVGSFKAVDGCEDGTDMIRLIHTDGFITDQYMDFDVRIEDGMITENIGGSHALPHTGEDLARILEGTWQEKLEGIATLDITPGADGGLDIVMSEGTGKDGTVTYYTMTAYYDVIKGALLYNNGTLHENAAITDGSQEQTESETEQGTGAGMLELVPGQEEDTIAEIDWTNSEGGVLAFVPAAE